MNADFITTYTKVHFTPITPKSEDVRIDDIAHALSLMTRANGHFKRFYSVAQHSINCAHEARAMGEDKEIQLACLLHDASEAYISDITRPVKKNLPEYLKVEDRLQNVIHKAFGIEPTPEVRSCVSKIDNTMLWHEFLQLMDERIYEPMPILHGTPDFSERRYSDVEREFLRLYTFLSGEDKRHKCVGVDGTKDGWLAVCLEGDTVDINMYNDIHKLCTEYSGADCIFIDIPIGLPESQSDIRPDKELRSKLKGKTSSVFNTPCRQAVYEANYQFAHNKNIEVLGKGLSKQSFAISNKIREVDIFLQRNPAWQNKLCESHPEYGFVLLNYGVPLLESKKTQAGVRKRISLLKQYIHNLDMVLERHNSDVRLKGRLNDIIDALCLAVIGSIGMTNGFLSIPDTPSTDSRNIKMQIVFAEV